MGLAVRLPRPGTASCCESETRHKKGGVPIRCPANCREEVQIPRLTKKFAEHGRGWNFTNEVAKLFTRPLVALITVFVPLLETVRTISTWL